MNRHEEALGLFVVRRYRSRFRESLVSKRRDKLLAALPSFRYWDERFLYLIPSSEQLPERIYEILTARGAPKRCHAVSISDRLDGRDLLLQDALDQTVGWEMGTVLSCIPGRLAYFEGEPPNERYVLER